MKSQLEVKFELTGQDAEKIVSDYVSAKMLEQGYKLAYLRNEDGPFPDTFFRGVKIEAA